MEGNQMKMREALEMARDALKSAEKYVYGDPPNGGAIGWDDVWPSEWHNALEAVERALSAPPRQCDVGTPEEQSDRFRAFCKKCKMPQFAESAYCAHECSCRDAADCKFAWAQTPYAAEKGAGE